MNLPSARPILVVLIAVTSTFTVRAAGGPAKSKTVLDFTRQDEDRLGSSTVYASRFEFSTDAWKEKIVFVDGRGLLVPARPGNGGFGADYRIDFGASTVAEIDVVIGSRNESESFVLALGDSDGTRVSWTLPLGGKSIGQKISYRLSLQNPDSVDAAGKKPGFEHTKIRHWEFRGNGQPDKIDITFVRIAAVPPEPTAAASH